MRYSKKIKRVASKLPDGWQIVRKYRWVSEDGGVTRSRQIILILKHENGTLAVIDHAEYLTPTEILEQIKHYENLYEERQKMEKLCEKYRMQLELTKQ